MTDTDDRQPDRPGGDDPGRGRRLGVDVGTVRIGVATSDPDGILATPVETVARDRRDVKGKHIRRLAQLAEELEAGMSFVNDNVRSDPRTPFGGVKHSGYGRECSAFGIREFTNIKTVHVKPMGHGGNSGIE